MPYNPDIAHIVFLRGYIEKIGRGTIMIADECKKVRLKTPVWNIEEHTVKLTFFSNVKLDGAIDGATKGVKEKLSILLKAIATNEGNRVPEYITAIRVSERTMERYLQQLKEAQLIEFRGEAAQTGGYYLTNDLKSKLSKK